MKKQTVFLFILIMFNFTSYGQTPNSEKKIFIDDFDLNSLPKKHLVQVMILLKPLTTNKYITNVDYGQASGSNPAIIKNENGELVSFTSIMNCINFFIVRGWTPRFHEITLSGNIHVHYFTLEKE